MRPLNSPLKAVHIARTPHEKHTFLIYDPNDSQWHDRPHEQKNLGNAHQRISISGCNSKARMPYDFQVFEI